jgi:hypothetical protein
MTAAQAVAPANALSVAPANALSAAPAPVRLSARPWLPQFV